MALILYFYLGYGKEVILTSLAISFLDPVTVSGWDHCTFYHIIFAQKRDRPRHCTGPFITIAMIFLGILIYFPSPRFMGI